MMTTSSEWILTIPSATQTGQRTIRPELNLPPVLNPSNLFIYLFLPPALNTKSYGRTRVLKAPSRPMLVGIGLNPSKSFNGDNTT